MKVERSSQSHSAVFLPVQEGNPCAKHTWHSGLATEYLPMPETSG